MLENAITKNVKLSSLGTMKENCLVKGATSLELIQYVLNLLCLVTTKRPHILKQTCN